MIEDVTSDEHCFGELLQELTRKREAYMAATCSLAQ